MKEETVVGDVAAAVVVAVAVVVIEAGVVGDVDGKQAGVAC